ncbi:MAG: DNRLRE domain-containing protein [Planctomycetes bacterium]|nr:DNRLRE domain-containing protein [Planctomycetota bacterium]
MARLRDFVAIALCALPAARADLVSIGSMKDTTIYADPAGMLGNGSGQYIFTGTNSAQWVRRGLIAFDVASVVPPGSTIDSVALTLHVSRSAQGEAPVGLHRITADWGEGASDAAGAEGSGTQAAPGDATWIHTFHPSALWATPGGDFVPIASATLTVGLDEFNTWSSPGMVSDVQTWLDAPQANFGWMLLTDESIPETAERFDSRNDPDPRFRPLLSVQYTVGEPGTVMLIGLAALPFARRSRSVRR